VFRRRRRDGTDFDFVYFVGPAAFARHFGLSGVGDMEVMTSITMIMQNRHQAGGPGSEAIREYYGLKRQ